MKEFIEKLIGRLEKQRGNICNCMPCNGCKYIGDCNAGEFAEDVALDKAIEIVNQLAEEYNNGWISCSERLPEIDKWVLGQGVYDIMLVCYTKSYGGDFDWMDINGDWRVISAWQPLPPPYKAGD